MFNPDSAPLESGSEEEPLDLGPDNIGKERKTLSEAGIDLTEMGEQIKEKTKEEAEKLGEKLPEKSFGERYGSAYVTRKTKIPGRGEFPGQDRMEKERGPEFRFQRGQIYKAFMEVRKQIKEAKKSGEDTTTKKALLVEMRAKAKEMEKNLDELNRQYYESVREVKVQTEYGEFTVPVARLDLRKPEDKEGADQETAETDERIPWVYLNGLGNNIHHTASLPISMALKGEKVYIPMPLEQPAVEKPANFTKMLWQKGDLSIHSAVAKQTIRELGINEVNVMGWSMGGTVAMELACDPDFTELNNLAALEPLGFKDKGLPQLAKEFGLQVALKNLPYAEDRTRGFLQGNDEGAGSAVLGAMGAKIISKKLFPPEKLKRIKPKGRFQVWMGTQSPIIDRQATEGALLKAEEIRIQEDPDASPLEVYEVKGGDHYWPVKNSFGFAELMAGEKPKDQVTSVRTSDLKGSAMSAILGDIARPDHE